jgi:hypothetical protein
LVEQLLRLVMPMVNFLRFGNAAFNMPQPTNIEFLSFHRLPSRNIGYISIGIDQRFSFLFLGPGHLRSFHFIFSSIAMKLRVYRLQLRNRWQLAYWLLDEVSSRCQPIHCIGISYHGIPNIPGLIKILTDYRS